MIATLGRNPSPLLYETAILASATTAPRVVRRYFELTP